MEKGSVYKYIGLYILAIFGIFIEFSFIGNTGNIIYKLFLFAGISYILYLLWKNAAVEKPDISLTKEETEIIEKSKEESRDKAFFDIAPARLDSLLEKDQPVYTLLLNHFNIIHSFILPDNGYLYFEDTSKQFKLIYKKQLPEINWQPGMEPRMVNSLVESKQDILLENNIESADNLLPFYNEQDYIPKALLAFKTVCDAPGELLWLFDSKTANTFNEDDLQIISVINNNTKLVLNQLLSYQGIDIAYRQAENNFDIANRLNTAENFQECIDIIAEYLIEEFEASKLTIATKDGRKDSAVIRKTIGIEDPFKFGFEFKLDDGLNGWVITKNKPYLLEDIDKGEYFIPRFSKDEKTNYQLRSFLSIPIQIGSEAIGMITLEDKDTGKYSDADKNRLVEYGNILSFAIQRFFKQE